MEHEKTLGDILGEALGIPKDSTSPDESWEDEDLAVDHDDVVVSKEDFLILTEIKDFYPSTYNKVKYEIDNRHVLDKEIANYRTICTALGDNKIAKVKIVRAILGCGLAQAKYYVENK